MPFSNHSWTDKLLLFCNSLHWPSPFILRIASPGSISSTCSRILFALLPLTKAWPFPLSVIVSPNIWDVFSTSITIKWIIKRTLKIATENDAYPTILWLRGLIGERTRNRQTLFDHLVILSCHTLACWLWRTKCCWYWYLAPGPFECRALECFENCE